MILPSVDPGHDWRLEGKPEGWDSGCGRAEMTEPVSVQRRIGAADAVQEPTYDKTVART